MITFQDDTIEILFEKGTICNIIVTTKEDIILNTAKKNTTTH